MKENQFIILFICQPGELELQSALLAYSLRKMMPDEQRIVAAIPDNLPSWVSENILSCFSALSVEIFYFHNTVVPSSGIYPAGEWMSNKFESLLSFPEHENILFLDSDIICLKNDLPDFPPSGLAAKPADVRTKADWEGIFKSAGMSLPKASIDTTVDHQAGPPYFNTGVLYIDHEACTGICKKWKDYFLHLSDPDVQNQVNFDLFHRDQLAFSLALHDSKMSVYPLREHHNYPIRHRRKTDPDTVLVHYHDVYTLAGNRDLRFFLVSMMEEFPSFRSRMNQTLRWRLAGSHIYPLLRMQHGVVKIISKIRKKFRSGDS